MTAPAQGHAFDQRRPAALAGALDRLVRRPVDVEHGSARSSPNAGHAVGGAPLGDRGDRTLSLFGVEYAYRLLFTIHTTGSRVQIAETFSASGQCPFEVAPSPQIAIATFCSSFRRYASGGAAGGGICDRKVGHHGHVRCQFAHVAVAVASVRVAVDAAPELRHHALQVEALRELRRQVAVGREGILGTERVRDADVRPPP